MVKKIRLVDQPTTVKEESSGGDGSSSELMELLKSMDWKLWEMLQTMQRLEKHMLNSNDTTEK